MPEFLWKNKNLLFLVAILTIASFFRLWQLNSIPPGLYPDVATNGNNAIETLKTGNFKVFYPENNGREGLFMWLLALSFSIFGTSIWSIKIVTATIGILTVLGLYLLTKELFNSQNSTVNSQFVALLASFLLATSFWHTNFSRIGFRAILVPFILVFAFYFLFKGFHHRRVFDFVVSGIFFGFGFYTYISFRIIAIVFFSLLLWWFLYNLKVRKEISFFAASTFCFLFLSFLIALPIGIYFLNHPQDFIGRAAGVSIFSQENPILAFGESAGKHLAMFNFHGDDNWRHNYAGSPMLSWPIGILFLVGFLFAILKGIYYAYYAPKNDNLSSVMSRNYGFLILWFLFALLPGILTYEGIPHALRTIGVIPIVYIFAGLAGWKIYQFFERNTKSKKLLFIASLLFLIAVSFMEFNKYFFDWGKNKEVAGAFTKRFSDIGYFLNSLPEDYQKYVIVNEPGVPVPFPDGIPVPAQTIMFIENMKYGSLRAVYLLPKDLNQIKTEKALVIVPMKTDKELFLEFSRRFPQGKIKKENGILIYEIR